MKLRCRNGITEGLMVMFSIVAMTLIIVGVVIAACQDWIRVSCGMSWLGVGIWSVILIRWGYCSLASLISARPGE